MLSICDFLFITDWQFIRTRRIGISFLLCLDAILLVGWDGDWTFVCLGEEVAVGPVKLKLKDEALLSGVLRVSKGFEESIIVVLKREVEKLGIPH